MRPRRAFWALTLTALVAATLTADVTREPAAADTKASKAELRAISTRFDGPRSTVLIEASEPVAYITSQPDPLTVLVDLRNVTAGQLPPGILGPLPPVSNVNVEEAVAGDGAPVARVRVSLAHQAKYRVRSSRNVIYVEVDRAVVPHDKDAADAGGDAAAAAAASNEIAPTAVVPTNARQATLIRGIRQMSLDGGIGIALVGDGRLQPSRVDVAQDLPPRVLLDFPGVSPKGLPAVVEVNKGGVQRVRVGTNSLTPLVTRVVIDLDEKATYRVAPGGANGEELHVLFDAAPAPPTSPAAAAAPAIAATADVDADQAKRSAPAPATRKPAPAPAAKSGGAVTPTSDTPKAPLADIAPEKSAPASQTAQPASPTAVRATGGQEPGTSKFTGHPITLDMQGADLRAVLRTFSDISGLNIVIDPSITGAVDVLLRDVPWDQALDIILKANKLGYAVDGTVVRIAPLNVLAQEEEERRKLTDAKALAGELSVLTVPLSYAKAPDLVPILTRSALSTRGEVQVDSRSNTLIVRDLPDRLSTVGDLVKTLDRPQPQVEIEARIVQTTSAFARAIGVEWGVNGRVDPALGNTTGLAFPNSGSVRGDAGGTQGPPGGPNSSTGVNLRAPAASSAVGIALGSINGAFNLDFVLSQLETTGRGRLLSTPRVSTQNNVEAEMTQGVQIPIQTVANNTVTVTFKDAALTLRVTPQITASNTIIMRVFLENATADFSRAVNGIPPIDTQRAVTTVLVADGETTVIGGIYVSQEQATNDRVPLMHRVPLLGWLFKRDTESDSSRELLIFITPRITKS